MNAIRIRKRLVSQILDLPELAPLLGKSVEIIVLEETPDLQKPPLGPMGGNLSPSNDAGQSAADLFAEWQTEDDTNDPAEIERRNQELEDFKQQMNRNRLEMEGPDSRTPFP